MAKAILRLLKGPDSETFSVLMGLADPALEVVRNDDLWYAAKEDQRPDMRTNPVWQLLRPGRFRIGVAGRTKDRNEDLCLTELPSRGIDDRDPLPTLVDK